MYDWHDCAVSMFSRYSLINLCPLGSGTVTIKSLFTFNWSHDTLTGQEIPAY